MDEEIMCYLAGARGIDTSFHQATSWTGRANNTLTAPDSSHIIYCGDATGKADMDSADKMDLSVIERLVAKAETLDPMIQPFMINGTKKFVLLMHTFQAFDLRTGVTENDWLTIHKATDRGSSSLMYKNALGEYADVILHKHRNVIRFSDYGASGTVPAGRALFLGAQAGLIAYGQNAGPQRYSWNEETDDRGNALAITAGTIFGIKKSRYNSQDFGVVAVDAYCKDPNA
jgi:N4-gp56 family major capsid protein